MQNQNDVLTSELTTFQNQVQVMKQELELYHRLLDNAVKSGTAFQTAAKPGLNLTGQKVLELLEEIRALREQLEGSIRTNQAMRERLRTSLEQSLSGMSHQHSPPTASRGTQASFTERGLHLQHHSRVAAEGDAGGHDGGGRLSPASSVHSGTGGHHAQTLPRSSRQQGTSTSFSHPRETSTPHGGHHSFHERSHSSHKEGHLRTHHSHLGAHHRRVHSGEHHVTTQATAGGTSSTHARPDLHRLHTLLTQTHDLDSMETKVQQVLDMPDLQVT